MLFEKLVKGGFWRKKLNNLTHKTKPKKSDVTLYSKKRKTQNTLKLTWANPVKVWRETWCETLKKNYTQQHVKLMREKVRAEMLADFQCRKSFFLIFILTKYKTLKSFTCAKLEMLCISAPH